MVHLHPRLSPQDNLIDEVDSIINAAKFLRENGAYKVYAVATHGILSRDAPELLEESPIEEVGETRGACWAGVVWCVTMSVSHPGVGCPINQTSLCGLG